MYVLHRLDLDSVRGATLIVDEFHNFKNQVRRSFALKRAIDAAAKTLLISATPYDHPTQESWVSSLFGRAKMPAFRMNYKYAAKKSVYHLHLLQDRRERGLYVWGFRATRASGQIEIPPEMRAGLFNKGFAAIHRSLAAPILRAVQHALQTPNQKVIVGLNFSAQFALFLAAFPNALVLNGSTPMSARKSIIDAFQDDPKHRLILVSVRVGGVGIELDDKRGNWPRKVYLLPTCNAVDFYQFIGRVCRTNTRSDSKIYVAQPYLRKTYFKRQMAVKSKVLEKFNTLPKFKQAFEEHLCMRAPGMLAVCARADPDSSRTIQSFLCNCLQ